MTTCVGAAWTAEVIKQQLADVTGKPSHAAGSRRDTVEVGMPGSTPICGGWMVVCIQRITTRWTWTTWEVPSKLFTLLLSWGSETHGSGGSTSMGCNERQEGWSVSTKTWNDTENHRPSFFFVLLCGPSMFLTLTSQYCHTTMWQISQRSFFTFVQRAELSSYTCLNGLLLSS